MVIAPSWSRCLVSDASGADQVVKPGDSSSNRSGNSLEIKEGIFKQLCQVKHLQVRWQTPKT